MTDRKFLEPYPILANTDTFFTLISQMFVEMQPKHNILQISKELLLT